MPFIIIEPLICDEFMLPNISASIAVLRAMTPNRRAIPGLLEISEGRRTTLFLKNPNYRTLLALPHCLM